MRTIVEYSATKRPVNRFPRHIVSPPAPKACCEKSMEQLGEVQEDGHRRYFYKRCRSCGFTVRHFLAPAPDEGAEGIRELMDLARQAGLR
jgi:hypothetical protein